MVLQDPLDAFQTFTILCLRFKFQAGVRCFQNGLSLQKQDGTGLRVEINFDFVPKMLAQLLQVLARLLGSEQTLCFDHIDLFFWRLKLEDALVRF